MTSSARPFANAAEHLLSALVRLDLLLEHQVERLRAARLITDDEFRGLYIPESYVDALLRRKNADLPERSGFAWSIRLAEHARDAATRVEASLGAGVDLPLERLRTLFGLSPVDMDALLIAVAPDVDSRYESLYAYAQNDVTKKRPSVGLVLKLLCASVEERLAARAAFDPAGALVAQRLVRLVADSQDRDPTLLAQYLSADRRIVDFLLGRDVMDERLPSLVRLERAPRGFGDLRLQDGLEASLRRADAMDGALVLAFLGPDRATKEAVAEALSALRRQRLLIVDVPQLLAADGGAAETARILLREARLQDASLYLDHFDALMMDEPTARARLREVERGLAGTPCRVFLEAEGSWRPNGRWSPSNVIAFDFALPDFDRRLALWEDAIGRAGIAKGVDVAGLADKFMLGAGQIRDAVSQARLRNRVRTGSGTLGTDDLAAAAREQSVGNLRRLAKKIEPVYRRSDIVLPARPMEQLREVFASARYRHVVYGRWGFGRKLSLGKGLSVLFSGPSGTGKTMAAEILASELTLDLYKIDLSTVVSKYIGETEKGLSSIFREAEISNAILFFDEADALFGKRSEVKDAHDRYANIEVAYLLMRMDEYEGIVILATNLSENLDEAFARRMHHIVEFPLPDAAHRERIWRGVFPREAPLAEDVDLGFLARQFELTGGNIRNVALDAAFRAAEEGAPIRMEHLVVATSRELEKSGKLPSRADFRHYYELIAERERSETRAM